MKRNPTQEPSRVTSRLGAFIEQARVARTMRRSDLARALGYKNIDKGVRRIEGVECGDDADEELIGRILTVLSLDERKAAQLLAEDRRQEREAWNEWADKPQPPSLAVRPMAAVWINKKLPEDATDLELIAAAREASRMTRQTQAVLIVSRRFHLVFAGGELTGWVENTPDISSMPRMTLGGGKEPVIFAEDDGDRS